jgi:hypothetical protein
MGVSTLNKLCYVDTTVVRRCHNNTRMRCGKRRASTGRWWRTGTDSCVRAWCVRRCTGTEQATARGSSVAIGGTGAEQAARGAGDK